MRDVVEEDCRTKSELHPLGGASGRTRADPYDFWVFPIDHLECLIPSMKVVTNADRKAQLPGWGLVELVQSRVHDSTVYFAAGGGGEVSVGGREK